MSEKIEDATWEIQSLAGGDEPYRFWTVERITEREAKERFEALKLHAKENGGYYKLLHGSELKETFRCSAENE